MALAGATTAGPGIAGRVPRRVVVLRPVATVRPLETPPATLVGVFYGGVAVDAKNAAPPAVALGHTSDDVDVEDGVLLAVVLFYFASSSRRVLGLLAEMGRQDGRPRLRGTQGDTRPPSPRPTRRREGALPPQVAGDIRRPALEPAGPVGTVAVAGGPGAAQVGVVSPNTDETAWAAFGAARPPRRATLLGLFRRHRAARDKGRPGVVPEQNARRHGDTHPATRPATVVVPVADGRVSRPRRPVLVDGPRPAQGTDRDGVV